MDDLISRQAILDMFEDINNHIIDGCGYKHDWCVEWVKGLPTKDTVKHGRWIEIEDDVFASTYKCSECGRWPFTEDGRWALTDYCPHCGARMDGEENG